LVHAALSGQVRPPRRNGGISGQQRFKDSDYGDFARFVSRILRMNRDAEGFAGIIEFSETGFDVF